MAHYKCLQVVICIYLHRKYLKDNDPKWIDNTFNKMTICLFKQLNNKSNMIVDYQNTIGPQKIYFLLIDFVIDNLTVEGTFKYVL